MKLKITILSLCIFLITSVLLSQPFTGGVIGGLNAAQVDGDKQKGYNKLGFYAGVYVAYDFSKMLGLRIETFYSGKGAKKKVNKIEEFKTQLNYIEMPFMLSLKPNDRWIVNAGISVGYLINSKLFEQGYEIPVELYDMKKFDWGGIIAGEYYITKKLAVNLRFEYSIIPFRDRARRWFNNCFSFGVLYNVEL